nr:MAG TPA: hypothetical protein [Caudoviricetes sp.]
MPIESQSAAQVRTGSDAARIPAGCCKSGYALRTRLYTAD